MADEITLSLKFIFEKGGTKLTFPDLDHQTDSVTVAGSKFIHNRQSIGFAAEEAIVLGEVTTGGYFVAINRDATNFLSIRASTGATNFVKLGPGEMCCFRIHSAASAPFAIADTAACELEYVLVAA